RAGRGAADGGQRLQAAAGAAAAGGGAGGTAVIGEGISRTDGPVKVTGRAKYSYERAEPGATLYGVIRGAGIARGRIVRIDTAAAEQLAGVRAVWTYRNAPEQ